MRNKYIDLIEQTFDWPQAEFKLDDFTLLFHDINLIDIIKQYGTPLKFTYLPNISANIRKAKKWFKVAMAKVEYQGTYNYCYCTKSNHFEHVINEVMSNNVHLETSSAFDINIIEMLSETGRIDKNRYIICNGFKLPQYIENIARLINTGYENTIPIIDNHSELDQLDTIIDRPFYLGIRIAAEEEPKFEFYTSRLGIGYKNIVPFYEEKIKNHPKFRLKMLHFFINTGINDNAYYWNELTKCINIYCELKTVCPELDSLNIGGGFPVKNSLSFDYDYEYMAEEIISHIKATCNQRDVIEPHIFTEFGTFTVGEAGGAIYSVVGQKKQNDREAWNMIDSSFMTTLPDTWAVGKHFILLPVNHWDQEYERVLLGGLTCDSDDYYNSELHSNAIYLPKFNANDPLYIGFFNTGAYQDSVGGFGGIQHCLTPAPKQIIIDRNEDGEITTRLFSKEQSFKSMLKILGY